MSTGMRGAIVEVERTFSTITDILSFLPGEHCHTVCFEVLVELPWIGVEASYSAENDASSSETLPGDRSTRCHHALRQLGK